VRDEGNALLVVAREGEPASTSYHARSAVDGDRLPGDVARGFGGEQHTALSVLAVPQALGRASSRDQLAVCERRLGHFRGEKSPADGVDGDAVLPHSAARRG